MQRLGAIPLDGRVEFRVWAPSASSVAVRLGGDPHELAAAGSGVFAGEVSAGPGDDYVFVLDGERELPDPCSRFQPQGIRGPSRVVEIDTPREFDGVPLDELVIYELHVGTFTDEGTFDAAIPHLAGLRELGVTAIELMPVATFPGNRGWGYDGLYAYAPHPAYGGPAGLARLVDAAHAAGLAVILDVVYNHLGPGNEALTAFGPYHRGDIETPWGAAMNYAEDGVREWALQNAEHWIRDYRIDGLRLDAVFQIHDDREPHVLAGLADRVHALNPRALVTAEMEVGNLTPIQQWRYDAQWADEFHHELHTLLSGERDGYYARYGSVDGLVSQLEREPRSRLVYCSQNHDQVGNRAVGDRPAADELPIRAALTLLAPQIPLLFMGEEYGERRPFQFFTDHVDPFIADATREGRRREFAGFAGFSADDVPDPQDAATFERSKLSRERDPAIADLYTKLLRARAASPPKLQVEANGSVLRLLRGDVAVVADLETKSLELA